jgi:hypothetical protein
MSGDRGLERLQRMRLAAAPFALVVPPDKIIPFQILHRRLVLATAIHGERSADTGARQGGDEFALVLPEPGVVAANPAIRSGQSPVCDERQSTKSRSGRCARYAHRSIA